MGSPYYRLSTLTLDDLVARAQASSHDDTPEMGEIIRRFEPLVTATASRASSDVSLRDDIANACRLAVVRATRSHTLGQAGFANYVKQYVRGEAGRVRERLTRGLDPSLLVPLGETLEVASADDVAGAIDAAMWGNGAVADVLELLPHPQQALLELRYVDDRTLADIAVLWQVTESAVSQRLRTLHNAVLAHLAAA